MSNNVDSVKTDELVNNVREDPNLIPEEKQFTFTGVKSSSEVQVYTEVAGMMRRLLNHPEFVLQDVRDLEGNRLTPDEYDGETVTGVRGRISVGCLKVRASSRSTSGYAEIISRQENRDGTPDPEDVEDHDVSEGVAAEDD